MYTAMCMTSCPIPLGSQLRVERLSIPDARNFISHFLNNQFPRRIHCDGNIGVIYDIPQSTNRANDQELRQKRPNTQNEQVMSRKTNKHIIFMCDTEIRKMLELPDLEDTDGNIDIWI